MFTNLREILGSGHVLDLTDEVMISVMLMSLIVETLLLVQILERNVTMGQTEIQMMDVIIYVRSLLHDNVVTLIMTRFMTLMVDEMHWLKRLNDCVLSE